MRTKTKKLIQSIRIVREVDTDPDLSWLGEYSNSPSGPFTIDREERGDCGRGEYRYFNCGDNYTGEPRAEMEKYCEQDYKRMENYNRSEWWMIGIYAIAEIVVNGTIQRIRSGGLWGIESDSDSSYFEEVAREELRQLAEQLESLGFSSRAVKSAMPKEIEFSDR